MKLTNTDEGRQYLINIFTKFLSEKHIHEIEDIRQYNAQIVDNGFIIYIDSMILLQEHAWLSWYLLNDAIRVLELFDAALTRVVCEVLVANQAELQAPRCIIRMSSVPICEETVRTRMPRCADVGHLLSISATVLHSSPPQVLQYQRQYQCTKCCHSFICVVSESDAFYTITTPNHCPSCGAASPNSVPASRGSDCRNRQQLRVQEQTRHLSVGMMPRSITVVLDDDLVDCAQPGDDVTVIGTVIRRWKKHRPNDLCDAEIVVLANNIQVTNQLLIDSQTLNVEAKETFRTFWEEYGERRFSARNAILSQICPLIYGMYYLKLALALVLSGSSSSNFNGLKVRGESHMLLIGDPGAAKSQLLKFASKVVPRSVITTGIGSTSAGLTVAAVKESGDWGLEAGALVLADGGVCCIDEFGGIREHDKTAIHEAMEQQTISVAKAGIVCKLRTRCSIIAATNPKGSYDLDRSISCNTAIASPLLSRFDLIFLLLDNCNETWDRRVSDFILHHQTVDSSSDVFDIEKLKSYFLLIKSNFQPKMTQEASNVIEKYYSWMRKSETSISLDRITMRFLESLIRLSQSHARLMMRHEVVLEDAIVTIAVMESTVYGSTILAPNEQLPSEFPLDPEEEYKSLENIILSKLHIVRACPPPLTPCQAPMVTNKPLIKRKHCPTPPNSSIIKDASPLSQRRRFLNRSVLDNFHIATQMNEASVLSNQGVLHKMTLMDNLFEDCKEDGGGDSIVVAAGHSNMFQDTMAGHPDLTDADFDL